MFLSQSFHPPSCESACPKRISFFKKGRGGGGEAKRVAARFHNRQHADTNNAGLNEDGEISVSVDPGDAVQAI